MARVEQIRPYVEKVLKEYAGTDTLIVDSDGDVPFRAGSAMYYVRMIDQDPPLVSLFARMVEKISKTPELLERLNEMNETIRFGRIFWAAETVIVATELVAETLDKEELENACSAIGSIADHFDTEIQQKFGGEVAFTDEGEKPEDTPAEV